MGHDPSRVLVLAEGWGRFGVFVGPATALLSWPSSGRQTLTLTLAFMLNLVLHLNLASTRYLSLIHI